MSKLRWALLATASLWIAQPAHAVPVVVATSASTATGLGDFGNAGINGLVSTGQIAIVGGTISFTPDATSPRAGVYDGTIPLVASTPYTGTLTPRNYLAAQPNDPATITYTAAQTSISLLWGSIDSYNTVTFNLVGGGTETVTGANAAFAPFAGTGAFVSITPDAPFTSVVFNSAFSALEFNPSVSVVPEPGSLALLGCSLVAIPLVFRRRSSGNTAI